MAIERRSDSRAMQIAEWIERARKSPDALKRVAYLICEQEAAGKLEIFVSEEIDQFANSRSTR